MEQMLNGTHNKHCGFFLQETNIVVITPFQIFLFRFIISLAQKAININTNEMKTLT